MASIDPLQPVDDPSGTYSHEMPQHTLLASHQGEPGSIRATPEFSQVGIVANDVAGRRVFSGISRFPRPRIPGTAPFSPNFTLIGSQDLDVKNRPSVSSRLHLPDLGRGGVVVRLFASHLSEPGSNRGGIAPGFSHVNRADMTLVGGFSGLPFPYLRISAVFSTSHLPLNLPAGFLEVHPSPPLLHSFTAPSSPHFTVTAAQELTVKSADQNIPTLNNFGSLRRTGFNPRPGNSGFLHVGIVTDDAVGRRVFLGISRFPAI
ncbi:hypothetical protein PR048_004968 [Dryococelus australis]|uniref:Uncharacterized protein n=1 Tax=Dryococelus australis TaxID=614101 RepID=A0ABQ9I8Z4_9NEOP|nr:hypothetical protein PR048_004968 [Dryococelus australis]